MNYMNKDNNENNFFNNLAIEIGITDVKVVRQFYYALVRTLYKTLKNNKKVEMPDWGIYKIKPFKARSVHNINTGGKIDVPATNTLRFEVDYKLKDKVKNL